METNRVEIPTPIGPLVGYWQGVGNHHDFTVTGMVKPASATYVVNVCLYWKDGQHVSVLKGPRSGSCIDTIWDMWSFRTGAELPDKTRQRVSDAIRRPILDAMKRTAPAA